MRAAFLLFLPLVACEARSGAAAASPAPSAAFAGCSAVFTSVLGWTLTCDDTTLVTREGDDVEALLGGARESLRSAFAGVVEERRDPVVVAGAARKGLQLSLRTPRKDLVAQGIAAVLEGDPPPARVVACLAGADEASLGRCRRELEELAAIPYRAMPPDGVRVRPRPAPAIAERPIHAPAECHLAANDRTGLLDCGDAVLGWSEPGDPKAVATQADATIADTARLMHLDSPQAAKRSAAACRIEGAPSKCTLLKWPTATLTLGSALVRGHTILAWCLRREGSTSAICDDVVATGATAPASRVR